MKKQKYIDLYVMMACLSNSKSAQEQSIDELLAAVLSKQDSPVAEQNTGVENIADLLAAY